MQKIDFSKTGGYPFTQSTLSFLQNASTETYKAFCFKILHEEPGITYDPAKLYVLYGVIPYPGTSTDIGISEGLAFYNGEMYFVNAQAPVSTTDTYVAKIVTTYSTSDPTTYFDTTTNNVHQNIKISFEPGATGTGICDIGNVFYWPSTFQQIQNFVDSHKESSFTSLTLSGTGISGTMYYRKNSLTNTLHIYGSVALTASSIFAAPPVYMNLATIPSAYRPAATTVPFKAYYRYHSSNILDDTSKDNIRDMNMEIRTDGAVNLGAIKPASNMILSFNTIIPLD